MSHFGGHGVLKKDFFIQKRSSLLFFCLKCVDDSDWKKSPWPLFPLFQSLSEIQIAYSSDVRGTTERDAFIILFDQTTKRIIIVYLLNLIKARSRVFFCITSVKFVTQNFTFFWGTNWGRKNPILVTKVTSLHKKLPFDPREMCFMQGISLQPSSSSHVFVSTVFKWISLVTQKSMIKSLTTRDAYIHIERNSVTHDR